MCVCMWVHRRDDLTCDNNPHCDKTAPHVDTKPGSHPLYLIDAPSIQWSWARRNSIKTRNWINASSKWLNCPGSQKPLPGRRCDVMLVLIGTSSISFYEAHMCQPRNRVMLIYANGVLFELSRSPTHLLTILVRCAYIESGDYNPAAFGDSGIAN